MALKNKTSKDKKGYKLLNDAADTLLNILDNNYFNLKSIEKKNVKFQNIIERELDVPKGISDGNIINMASQLNMGKNKFNNLNIQDILTDNAGDLFKVFQDFYKNKYNEIQNLKYISKWIPALGEAVNTTLDYITSADDITDNLLRSFRFPAAANDNQRELIVEEINKIEKNLKLKKKIKNLIYKNALVTGTAYVYAVPYSKLFNEFDRLRERRLKDFKWFQKFANESITLENLLYSETELDNNINISQAIESVIKQPGIKLEINEISEVKTNFKNSDFSIKTSNIGVPLEVLESTSTISSMINKKDLIKNKTNHKTFIGHTMDTCEKSDEDNKYEKINDVYIKVLDFKRVIPIIAFEETYGYLYAYNNKKKNYRNNNDISSILDNTSLNGRKKTEIINKLVENISNQIIKNFSPTFISNNAEFKKSIADCIIYNGLADNDYNIQFIPKEDIIEFKINENEHGEGQSMLSDSLLPATMLLSILICKELNYINKSGNRTLAHVYRNSIDQNSSNRTQEVIRNLMDNEVIANDLLSTRSILSKLSRNGVTYIPTSRDGKKLVEFEVMEGQNIDMDTAFENKLEDMTILSTRVPTVIIEYTHNRVDYAKQIVGAHIKYSKLVSSLQDDFEDPTTELYRRCLLYSTLDDEHKNLIKQDFGVILPRPKTLSITNSNEHVDNLTRLSDSILNLYYSQDNNPKEAVEKRLMNKKIFKMLAPFLDWESIDKLKEESMKESSKMEIDNENNKNNDESMDGGF